MMLLYCNVFIDIEIKENEKKNIVLLFCLYFLKDSCMNFWCILYYIYVLNEEYLFIYKVCVVVNLIWKNNCRINKGYVFL